MGTKQADPETVGYITRANETVRLVADNTSMTMYGRRGSLYPLILVITAIVAVALLLLVEGWVYGLVALLSLGLLGIWVGGSGR